MPEYPGFSMAFNVGGTNSDRLEAFASKAYGVLSQECLYHAIGSYPWAPVGALVTDRYGVQWWLRTQ